MLKDPNADELRCKSDDFTTILGEPLKCELFIGNEDEKAPEKITINYGDNTTETFDKFEGSFFLMKIIFLQKN